MQENLPAQSQQPTYKIGGVPNPAAPPPQSPPQPTSMPPSTTPPAPPTPPPAAPKPQESIFRKKWFWIILAVIILIPGAIFLYIRNFTSYVEVSDQPVNETSIHINKLNLKKGGFLIIHPSNDYGVMETTWAVAQSIYLPPDTYTRFNMPLLPLEARNNKQLLPGDRLFAAVYEDSDGDKDWRVEEPIMKNSLGKPIVEEFTLLDK